MVFHILEGLADRVLPGGNAWGEQLPQYLNSMVLTDDNGRE
jgi:hypothetical protein